MLLPSLSVGKHVIAAEHVTRSRADVLRPLRWLEA
jgi:hypothetical protein